MEMKMVRAEVGAFGARIEGMDFGGSLYFARLMKDGEVLIRLHNTDPVEAFPATAAGERMERDIQFYREVLSRG